MTLPFGTLQTFIDEVWDRMNNWKNINFHFKVEVIWAIGRLQTFLESFYQRQNLVWYIPLMLFINLYHPLAIVIWIEKVIMEGFILVLDELSRPTCCNCAKCGIMIFWSLCSHMCGHIEVDQGFALHCLHILSEKKPCKPYKTGASWLKKLCLGFCPVFCHLKPIFNEILHPNLLQLDHTYIVVLTTQIAALDPKLWKILQSDWPKTALNGWKCWKGITFKSLDVKSWTSFVDTLTPQPLIWFGLNYSQRVWKIHS